ncbi:hypothetical protein BGX21_004578, partial [Mortierella sp. AD011]
MKIQSTLLVALGLAIAVVNAVPVPDAESNYITGRKFPKASLELEADYGSGRRVPRMSFE